MVAIVALLVALPLGFFCTKRAIAFIAYIAVFAHVYTFQTATLVMEWVNGNASAFPQEKSQNMVGGSSGYLAVTSLVYLVGFGLVWVGSKLRTRREGRAVVSADFARATA